MFIKNEKKNWGSGIPKYNKNDLMTPEELYDFALDIVAQFEIKAHNCYKPIDCNPSKDSFPSMVVEAKGKLIFILVEADVAPKMPKLSNERKEAFLKHCKKHNAEAFYAAVGFGACDEERFNKSLALRGDAYYANYIGLEPLDGAILPYGNDA